MESAATIMALEADLLEVVEAVLFVSDEPVHAETIAGVYGEVTGQAPPAPSLIEEGIERLNGLYASSGRVFRIRRWAGGYQIATEARVEPFLRVLFADRRVRKLSRSLLESLAIVAYRQPVSKPEIDAVRGVDASYSLRKLLELGFIEIVGRADAVGRPLVYGTTDRFLAQFGLDRLEDLPMLKELDELMNDPDVRKESMKYLSPDPGVEGFTEAGNEEEHHGEIG